MLTEAQAVLRDYALSLGHEDHPSALVTWGLCQGGLAAELAELARVSVPVAGGSVAYQHRLYSKDDPEITSWCHSDTLSWAGSWARVDGGVRHYSSIPVCYTESSCSRSSCAARGGSRWGRPWMGSHSVGGSGVS